MRGRRIRVMIATTTAAATFAACDLVVGDSLVVNSLQVTGEVVDGVKLKGLPGTAPCDYRAQAPRDVAAEKPARVSLMFSGNSFTPCMRDASGQYLRGDALVARYRVDLTALANYLLSAGVKRVIFSAPPCVGPDNHGYRNLANGYPGIAPMERNLAATLRSQGKSVAYSQSAAESICGPGNSWDPVDAQWRTADQLHLNRAGSNRYGRALVRENKSA